VDMGIWVLGHMTSSILEHDEQHVTHEHTEGGHANVEMGLQVLRHMTTTIHMPYPPSGTLIPPYTCLIPRQVP
jgi:hypothetical protein